MDMSIGQTSKYLDILKKYKNTKIMKIVIKNINKSNEKKNF